jgi:uncharacterized membrane protein YdjX (TVP38/TMEM64 family)
VTAELEEIVVAAGVLGPIAFVMAYALLTVGLVPGSVATVAGGALFGPFWGTILVLAGASLGAIAAFAIARRAGRERVKRRLGERLNHFDERLTGSGFLAVLVVRLVPIAPFNLTNYAFGVSGVHPRDYTSATVIGIVPGTIAFVALGSSLGNPGSPGFFVSIAAVAALIVVVPLVERRLRGRPQTVGGGRPEVRDPAASDARVPGPEQTVGGRP